MTVSAARDLLAELRALRGENAALRAALEDERAGGDRLAEASARQEEAMREERAASDRALEGLKSDLAAERRRSARGILPALLVGLVLGLAAGN